MGDAQGEELKHFGMDFEFLLRKIPKWKETLQPILFKDGDIVKLGKKAKKFRVNIQTAKLKLVLPTFEDANL